MAAPLQRATAGVEPVGSGSLEGGADAPLLAGLQRGEPQAMAQVWARYHERVHSFVLRLCREPAWAEDLLQETFVRLGRHAAQLSPQTPLLPWLYTVARNLYRSDLRKRVGWLRRLPLLSGDFEPPAPTPWSLAVARDQARRLEAALLALPDAYREALLLVYVEGTSTEQAALILGLEPATLRKRLSRGKAQLRAALGEELP